MKKALLLGLLSAVVLTAVPIADAAAHGRHYRPHTRISVGLGYGFGYGYYRPFGYYYPPGYLGVGVWPAPRRHRVKDEQPAEPRMKQLYVYPAAGQSEEQLADDRYNCHVWAADQSDFDPTLGAGSAEEADDYARAFTACMEARDYVVK